MEVLVSIFLHPKVGLDPDPGPEFSPSKSSGSAK